MRNSLIPFAVVACAFAVAAADATATFPTTLVVDRDRVQCPGADHTSIQDAVREATAGDVIVVCPDVYAESVVVDKPLTLIGNPDAVAALDCFQETLPPLSDDQFAIVDPPSEGFSIAFKLEADDVALGGFVIQGASVGVDTSDLYSGYRIHRNFIRLNTLFGIDFGSGSSSAEIDIRESRFEENCLRQNRFGLVSELDDDSLWPNVVGGGGRVADKARDLSNARIERNSTFRNAEGIAPTGPGTRANIAISSNVLVQDRFGIALQNSSDSSIAANRISTVDPPIGGLATFPLFLGGANFDLRIAGNSVSGGRTGVTFQSTRSFFLDAFLVPSTDVTMVDNVVTGARFTGIALAAGSGGVVSVVDSHFEGNSSNANGFHGFIILGGNHDNTFERNDADRNGGSGMYATAGAYANVFKANSMHGNGTSKDPALTNRFPPPFTDARDDNWPENTWVGNACDTDFPDDAICGVG